MIYDKDGYCCIPLRNAYNGRYNDGIFIYAYRDKRNSNLLFRHGFRSIKKDDVKKFQESLNSINTRPDVCIKINMCGSIKYCPWCGCELKEYYKNKESLIVDEEMHKEWDFDA